ncbi:MAG: hypothetical protein AAFR50_11275, partial [Pseudomonadota bacterium]
MARHVEGEEAKVTIIDREMPNQITAHMTARPQNPRDLPRAQINGSVSQEAVLKLARLTKVNIKR